MIDAAAPAGALPRRLQFPVFPETELAPPCLGEALKRGALAKEILMIFIGCERPFMCVSTEPFFLKKKDNFSAEE
jgi:hypothetical protein